MRLFGLALLLAMVGCAHPHRVAGPNLIIDVACLKGPVRMIDCDQDHCKTAKVLYRKDCARLEVPKEDK